MSGYHTGVKTSLEQAANLESKTDDSIRTGKWPVGQERQRPKWFPAPQRLIGQVRQAVAGSAVLPPAVVRKASWRE